MLVFFPVHGYYLWSIIFSTLHIFASYFLVYFFYKDSFQLPSAFHHSARWMRWALIFMVLSTLGPYALGIIMAKGLESSPWYRLAIYFYLHFQYNAWFIFQSVALLLAWFAAQGQFIKNRYRSTGFAMATVGVMLTFAQSALWINVPAVVKLAATVGGILQLAGFLILLPGWWRAAVNIQLKKLPAFLLSVSVFALIFKSFLQALSVVPAFTALSFAHQIVIAFLHLVFLGSVTPFLFGLGWQSLWLRKISPMQQNLMKGFIVFFTITELILISNTLFPDFANTIRWPQTLFYFTLAMVACLLVVVIFALNYQRERFNNATNQ